MNLQCLLCTDCVWARFFFYDFYSICLNTNSACQARLNTFIKRIFHRQHIYINSTFTHLILPFSQHTCRKDFAEILAESSIHMFGSPPWRRNDSRRAGRSSHIALYTSSSMTVYFSLFLILNLNDVFDNFLSSLTAYSSTSLHTTL